MKLPLTPAEQLWLQQFLDRQMSQIKAEQDRLTHETKAAAADKPV